MAKPCVVVEPNELIKELREAGVPASTLPGIQKALGNDPVRICGKGKGGKRGTRAPSAYNIFMGKCVREPGMKDKPHRERFKGCAARWKREKK